MKLFKPLKYVITAAAVCILCFSGNGGYFYAVLAFSPENDIIDIPEQNVSPCQRILRRNNGCDRCSIGKKSTLKCISAVCSFINHRCDIINTSSFAVPDPSCQKGISSEDSENFTLHRLFSAKFPGNRSP